MRKPDGASVVRSDFDRPSESQGGSANVVLLRRLGRQLLKSPGAERAWYRSVVVRALRKVPNYGECVDELLHLCATEGRTFGLDTAIDILSETGALLLDYGRLCLKKDLLDLGVGDDTDRAYKPSDDYWYVLLRAVGRTSADVKERYRFIASCADAVSPGIREAVVLALQDLGTPAAAERIRRFMTEDDSPAVRTVAQQAIEDLEN